MGMKQILVMMVAVVLVGCGEDTRKAVPIPPASKNIIADNIVDKAIRKELGKPISGLTNADLEKVTYLDLSNTKITEEGLKELAKLQNLTKIALRRTKITDEGLKEVAKLQNLIELDLQITKITDAGLKEVAKLQNLKQLSLVETQISDAGLKEVAKLQKLERLNLYPNAWAKDNAGVAELKRALPNCEIEGP